MRGQLHIHCWDFSIYLKNRNKNFTILFEPQNNPIGWTKQESLGPVTRPRRPWVQCPAQGPRMMGKNVAQHPLSPFPRLHQVPGIPGDFTLQLFTSTVTPHPLLRLRCATNQGLRRTLKILIYSHRSACQAPTKEKAPSLLPVGQVQTVWKVSRTQQIE